MDRVYRIQQDGEAEPYTDGGIKVLLWIESSSDGEKTWNRDLVNGHHDVVLSGTDVLAITKDEKLSESEKKDALLKLARGKVAVKKIDLADEAAKAWNGLVAADSVKALKDKVIAEVEAKEVGEVELTK